MSEFSRAVESGLRQAGVDFARPLLLAVSGGPDSTALLLACSHLQHELGLEVTAAHFNHRLRAGAAEDETYVKELCGRLGVPCVTGEGDVAAHATSRHASLEAAARDLRYGFLARAAAESGAQGVATGHTLEDQAETVILHLVRGSGLTGLAGMRARSERQPSGGASALIVFRPLLHLRHAETRAFCMERDYEPREDPSNRDLRFARNRVRLRVLPELEKLNPQAIQAIARMADTVPGELEVSELVLQKLRSELAGPWPGELMRRPLRELPPALVRRLLLGAYKEAAGTTEGLTNVHIEDMARELRQGAGRSLDLPRGVRFQTTHDYVRLAPASGGPADCPFPAEVVHTPLPVPGQAELGGFDFALTARVSYPSDQLTTPDGRRVYLDAALAATPLHVRARQPGDRFHPAGMPGPVRLQDFFVDQHVPRVWRDRVPLVVCERGIAWVGGYRVAQWALPPEGADYVLRLELVEQGGHGVAPDLEDDPHALWRQLVRPPPG